MHNENLVKMANDISNFFQGDADHESAVKGMVEHLNQFWDPSMRNAITEHYRKGGAGLNELSKEAIKHLATS